MVDTEITDKLLLDIAKTLKKIMQNSSNDETRLHAAMQLRYLLYDLDARVGLNPPAGTLTADNIACSSFGLSKGKTEA